MHIGPFDEEPETVALMDTYPERVWIGKSSYNADVSLYSFSDAQRNTFGS